jgi:hypothetical protein
MSVSPLSALMTCFYHPGWSGKGAAPANCISSPRLPHLCKPAESRIEHVRFCFSKCAHAAIGNYLPQLRSRRRASRPGELSTQNIWISRTSELALWMISLFLGKSARGPEGAAIAAAAHGLETNLNRSSCQIQDRAPFGFNPGQAIKIFALSPPSSDGGLWFYIIGGLCLRDLNGCSFCEFISRVRMCARFIIYFIVSKGGLHNFTFGTMLLFNRPT